MSHVPFHDTVTLYLRDGDGSAFSRRPIRTVKVQAKQSLSDGNRLTVYLPLYGRRTLRYVDPEAYRKDPAPNRFTVRPGDYLAVGWHTDDMPPDSAYRIDTVTVKTAGTRRLHHIHLTAVSFVEESEVPKNE